MIYFIIIITLIIIASTIVISFYLTKKLAEPITISTETLRTVSSEVSEKSNDIKSAATNLNDYSTELSSSVQETVSTLDELTSMVSKNLENVTRSSESSKNSKQAAEQGLETIKNLLTAFNDMTESNKVIVNDMETTTQQMIEITSVINEIAQKTDMINDIVFQTKLLAFNASVEAARAGEHGKGFSVVAEEVGSLANASGNAAKEITEMVTDSVAKVNTIVDQTKKRIEVSTKEGKDKLNIGYEIAKQCGDKLQDILNNVNQVNTSINEVRVASDEQSSGITEVSKAMSSLDNVSNQTENMARELLNSSNNMSLRSVDLSGIVTELDSLLDGNDTKKKETTHEVQKIAQIDNVSSLDERRKA